MKNYSACKELNFEIYQQTIKVVTILGKELTDIITSMNANHPLPCHILSNAMMPDQFFFKLMLAQTSEVAELK